MLLRINLYPKRTSKPSKHPKTVNLVIAKENIDFIRELMNNGNNISKTLLGLCCLTFPSMSVYLPPLYLSLMEVVPLLFTMYSVLILDIL